MQSQERAREVLDYLLRNIEWDTATTRQGHALERLRYKRFYSRCLLLRSHDKLTRLGDTFDAYQDLDLAIVHSPNSSMHSLRAPMRLQAGRLCHARADLEIAVAAASLDAPDLHQNLYALAALYVRQGEIERGRPLFERARRAEARHLHLYGQQSAALQLHADARMPNRPVPVLQFYKHISFAVYAPSTLALEDGERDTENGGEDGGGTGEGDEEVVAGMEGLGLGVGLGLGGGRDVAGLQLHERDVFIVAV